jgi:ubiquinone/menaquinone biosynthesis C-methylase UbiE
MSDHQSVFSRIAEWQEAYRPPYPTALIELIVKALATPPARAVVADIGAGTGRWSRQLIGAGLGQITAVEPNQEMRAIGLQVFPDPRVIWQGAEGTATGLPGGTFDLVTWASSLHHAALGPALAESRRLLAPGGCLAIVSQGRRRAAPSSRLPARGALAISGLAYELAAQFPRGSISIATVEQHAELTAEQAQGYLFAVAHLQQPERAEELQREGAVWCDRPDATVRWCFVHSAVIVAGAGPQA